MKKFIAGVVAGLMLGTLGTATAGSINAWRHYQNGDFKHEAGNYEVGMTTLISGEAGLHAIPVRPPIRVPLLLREQGLV